MKRQHENAGTILIVDDIPANLAVMVETLEQYGHRVVVAQDGNEGLLRATLVQPDVILLDVMMPGLDGLEVCRQLRLRPETQSIPVIFMTALSETADTIAGFAAGGTDYITKPFHVEEALVRIETQIKLRAMQRQLESQNRELREYRNSLEQLVASRTAELHASNDRLSLVDFALNRVRESAYLVDEQAHFVYVNDETCRALGYSREELLSMTLNDICPTWTCEELSATWRGLAEAGTMVVETVHRCCNGDMLPVEISASRFEYGGRRYALALARDITERNAAQARLHASEQAFRALAENSPDYIARYDTECRRLYLNPAILKASPVPASALLGTPPEQTSLSDMPRYGEQLRKVLETGEQHAEEVQYRDASGDIRWGHMRMVPEFGPDGRIASVLAVCRDINELKESEQRFRTLADNLPDVIIRYDTAGKKLYVNAAMMKLTGADSRELVGQSAEETGVVLQLEDYSQALRRTLETGSAEELEVAVQHATDGVRVFNIRFCAERDERGHILGALMVSRDITERKRADEELARYRGHLEELVVERTAALQESKARLRSLIDNLPFEFCAVDSRLCYIMQNSESIRKRGSVVGKRVADLELEPGVAARWEAQERRVLADETLHMQFEKDEDGETRAYDCIMAPTKVDDAVVGIVGVAIDVTDRKRAEDEIRSLNAELELRVQQRTAQLEAMNRELRDSELRFRTLAEGSPNIIMRYDAECRCVYANPAYQQETELSREDAVSAMSDALWPADVSIPSAEYRAALLGVMSSGRAAELQLSWSKRISGEIVHHALQVVPEYDESGTVKGALAIGHNITALVEAEKRLRESFGLLQELTTRRETAREEERKRIAREIHDELGQHLTALRMGVSTLRFQFGQKNPLLAERVQDMTALADKTIQVVRDVAASLRPAVLDSGLGAALEWLAAQFEQRTGIPTLVDIADDGRGLDEDRAMALFRIVQESLTNIVRHANAKWVTISLSVDGNHCIVQVRDGGRGFVPSDGGRKSFGLVGMRERALMLGGEIAVESEPGFGTVVTAKIPLGANGDTA